MLAAPALRPLALRALLHEADALHAFVSTGRMTVCTRRLGVAVGALRLGSAVAIWATMTVRCVVDAIARGAVTMPGAVRGTVAIAAGTMTARRLGLRVTPAMRTLLVTMTAPVVA